VLGDTVTVEGHHLNGTNRAVRVENRQLGVEREIVALPGAEADSLRFTVPNLPADLPAGTYALTALVQRPGEAFRRSSNLLSLTILPEITTALPLSVARDGAGVATVNLACRPEIRLHQRAALVVGALEVLAGPHPASTPVLTFTIADAPVGTHLARLRVDGIDSLIVDRTADPPVFLDRRITIT
jgi:hypothetical protein